MHAWAHIGALCCWAPLLSVASDRWPVCQSVCLWPVLVNMPKRKAGDVQDQTVAKMKAWLDLTMDGSGDPMKPDNTHAVDFLNEQYNGNFNVFTETIKGVQLRVEAMTPLWAHMRQPLVQQVLEMPADGGALEFYVSPVQIGWTDDHFLKERSKMPDVKRVFVDMLEESVHHPPNKQIQQ